MGVSRAESKGKLQVPISLTLVTPGGRWEREASPEAQPCWTGQQVPDTPKVDVSKKLLPLTTSPGYTHK